MCSSDLEQIGDVGRVERLDEIAHAAIVAGIHRVEHLAHKFRLQAIILVKLADGRGRMQVIFAHDDAPSAGHTCVALGAEIRLCKRLAVILLDPVRSAWNGRIHTVLGGIHGCWQSGRNGV
mgnify:CR=1 FL=1